MGLPNHPVTLSVEQVAELNRKLSALRHDVNNHLSLISAVIEILQLKPDTARQMAGNLLDKPTAISKEIRKFSDVFEQTLGITKD